MQLHTIPLHQLPRETASALRSQCNLSTHADSNTSQQDLKQEIHYGQRLTSVAELLVVQEGGAADVGSRQLVRLRLVRGHARAVAHRQQRSTACGRPGSRARDVLRPAAHCSKVQPMASHSCSRHHTGTVAAIGPSSLFCALFCALQATHRVLIELATIHVCLLPKADGMPQLHRDQSFGVPVSPNLQCTVGCSTARHS